MPEFEHIPVVTDLFTISKHVVPGRGLLSMCLQNQIKTAAFEIIIPCTTMFITQTFSQKEGYQMVIKIFKCWQNLAFARFAHKI